MNSASKPAQRQTLANSRLRKHADYLRAYAASRKRQSPAMSWFLAPQALDGVAAPVSPRVGLTVGKVIGKAHERNRIKRRMREVLRRHVDLLPVGFDLILHPRRSVLTIEFAQLKREVLRILEQAQQQAQQRAQQRAKTDAASSAQPAAVTPNAAGPSAS
jgi:ribonuclease P protein component